uniref:YiiX/YebB-like N1pC/P60 family cysteine hydrolase n=1 Tax=Alloprevotella sp. TaxID=1872471 RepID=UPI003FEF7241
MSDMLKLGILVAGLCITLAACNTRNKLACNIHPTDLREGDVIFRRGTSANSRMVTLLQGFYSHVGIVADSSGKGDLRILHAVPDEPDFPGDHDRIKMDRLETYLSPKRAEAACLMRQNNAQAAHQAACHALLLWKKGIRFDAQYNEQDTTEMYCTEFVAYVYKQAGIDIAGNKRDTIQTPWFSAKCLMPYHLQQCKKLKRVLSY